MTKQLIAMAIDKSMKVLALLLGKNCLDKEYAQKRWYLLSKSEVSRLLLGYWLEEKAKNPKPEEIMAMALKILRDCPEEEWGGVFIAVFCNDRKRIKV